jgi:ATP-dependent DNA helicase RecG
MEINILDIPGVGPKTQKKLNRLGIFSIDDLINYFPYRFEDRSSVIPVNELIDKEKQLIYVKIKRESIKKKTGYNKDFLEVSLYDNSGYIKGIWFNQPYVYNIIINKEEIYLFGKTERINNKTHIINPEILSIEKKETDFGFTPIYRLSKGIKNNEIKKIIFKFFQKYYEKIENIIPEDIVKRYNLLDRKNAIYWLHFPLSSKHYNKAKITMAFEELFVLYMGLYAIKKRRKENKGIYFKLHEEMNEFKSMLPFELTEAQNKVLEEISSDMNSHNIMNRLVQGDVGSGKTVTAFFSVYLSWKNKFQTALLVPTEILARQHYESFKSLFKDEGINFELLLGSNTQKEKRRIKEKIKEGELDFVIGTHSLIQEDVMFKNLGLVITDEQHRFGVRQRALLIEKGKNPDTIVMSATPIPRTLSLIIYGDLDISVIDKLPPGRQKVDTHIIKKSKYDDMLDFIENQLKVGRQVYFVAPAINDNESELESVENIFSKIEKRFKDFKIQIIHGKQSSTDKADIFKDFLQNNINILISTTVIEVGVNVPNASVMVIEGAERFGLSQLHQLRGRVGRGQHKSYCFLVTESKSINTFKRLKILCQSNDGFFISNEDLKLRGPGEFLGTKQHGQAELKFVNTYNYEKMIEIIKMESEDIISGNSKVDKKDIFNLNKKILEFYKNKKIILN